MAKIIRSGKASQISESRKQRGSKDRSAMFPVAATRNEMPNDYAAMLADLKQRIRQERVRVVLASNTAMVLLYWDIGRRILDKQAREGWGTRVIDRLAMDLREAFPEMRGLSPRNLKYMRGFAAAWPDRQIVQQPVAQLPWGHCIVLLDKLDTPDQRLWYVRKALEHGWSRNVLVFQIEARAIERQGAAQNNFPATLPPPDSDMAMQIFKDP